MPKHEMTVRWNGETCCFWGCSDDAAECFTGERSEAARQQQRKWWSSASAEAEIDEPEFVEPKPQPATFKRKDLRPMMLEREDYEHGPDAADIRLSIKTGAKP